MWKLLLTATGALSAAVIVLSAVIALDGGAREPEDVGRDAAVQPDEGSQPDPSATGVIAARAGDLLHLFNPAGERLGVKQAVTFQVATSTSGVWQAYRSCPGQNGPCSLLIARLSEENLKPVPVALPAGLQDGAWSPGADVLAALDDDGGLRLVDPTTLKATLMGKGVTTYAWSANGSLIYATFDGGRAELRLAQGARARLMASLASPVTFLVPSPDRTRFAFVQDGSEGWRLSVAHEGGAVHDAANPGRASAYGDPETRAPDSAAISWSPDGRYISVSPVAQPFVMFVTQTDGEGRLGVYYLKDGYAGEMKWSPDGGRLAVSTYSLDRKQHNVYLLESLESNRLRFLIDGCLIFWSPDGRFLANHREPRNGSGMALTRVEDGHSWVISPHVSLVPASWGSDEQSAVKLAELPPRGIGGLGK